MEKSKELQQEVETLLQKLDISGTVEVADEEEGYKVTIQTEENGLLIGKHGNTLSSLELILALIMAKKTGEFKRVIVEVGDYRREREEYLRDLATRLREEVIAQGAPKTIHGLKPWERRLIHLYLSQDPDVTTESEGDERERVLAIKKK